MQYLPAARDVRHRGKGKRRELPISSQRLQSQRPAFSAMSRNAPENTLADSGTLLGTTHRLDSGLRVRLRLTRPSDVAARPRLPGAAVAGDAAASLPDADAERAGGGREPLHLLRPARAARDRRERCRGEGGDEIVGLGDVCFVSTGIAEIGLVVEEEHQSHGIGRLIAEAIASLAVSRGATHLKAEMLDSSPAVMKVLGSIGRTVTADRGRARRRLREAALHGPAGPPNGIADNARHGSRHARRQPPPRRTATSSSRSTPARERRSGRSRPSRRSRCSPSSTTSPACSPSGRSCRSRSAGATCAAPPR